MARPLGPVPEHGTRQRYQLRGNPCRGACPATPTCAAAHAAYVAAWRARRRGPVQLELPPELRWQLA